MDFVAAVVRHVYGRDYHIFSQVMTWVAPTRFEVSAAAAAELVLRYHICGPWNRLDRGHQFWADRLATFADFTNLALVCDLYPPTCHWARERVHKWLADGAFRAETADGKWSHDRFCP